MRHYKKGRKLGTDASHTKAIKKNLVVNLFTNDRIKTTLERAKEIRSDVDRVVTWAKRGDVHSRRLAIAKLGNKDLVAEIFSKVEQGMFADRPGGYTRILRLGMRRGDSATIVIMELVREPVAKKSTDKATDAKPAAKKTDKGDKAAAKKTDKKSASKTAEETAADDVRDDEDIVDVEPVEADGDEVEDAAAEATESEPAAAEAEAAEVEPAAAEATEAAEPEPAAAEAEAAEVEPAAAEATEAAEPEPANTEVVEEAESKE